MTAAQQNELDFWKEFITTDQFKSWLADGVTPELQEGQPEVVQLILSEYAQNKNLKLLDCGSGVISVLNGLIPAANIDAIDLLAEHYWKIFDYADRPKQQPYPISTEQLTEQQTYDIVHMRNALDHTEDATDSFHNLYAATKKGGCLIIHGFENEGAYEKYQGLHQWNMRVENNDLIIADKQGEVLRHRGTRGINKTLPTGKKYFIWMLQK